VCCFDVKFEMAYLLEGLTLEETPIIICDVSSQESLGEMCKQAKVVLNCVGPVSKYTCFICLYL
jgi:short subunit dehydrogenase-like uncharacterized protein